MYTYIVQRTQIYLTQDEAGALDREARRTGHTRSHLIREAIRDKYLASGLSDEEFERLLNEAAGAWAGETDEEREQRDGWLRALRGPGLGKKIDRLRGEIHSDPDQEPRR